MSAELEQRLTALEIKASFTEDLLDQLDGVVARQQEMIDRLVREVARLQQAPAPDQAGPARNPSDDLPPHY